MFYVDVDVTISQFEGKEIAKTHKRFKQSYVSTYLFEREKKAVLLLISNNISIKEKLSQIMEMVANFHDNKEIKKYIYY